MFFTEVLPKEVRCPIASKVFADATVCEHGAESVADTDEGIAHWNVFNKFLHIVTSYDWRHVGTALDR